MKIIPRGNRLLSQVSPYHLIIIGSCSSFLPTPPKYMNVLINLKVTVPTFVTAHTFCASRDTGISYGWCLLIQGYFAGSKIMRRKQKLASAVGIQKEKWGVTMHFSEIIKLQYGKNAIRCFAFYCFFELLLLNCL